MAGGQSGLGVIGGEANGSVLSALSAAGGAAATVRSTWGGALVPSAAARAVTNAWQLLQRDLGSLASPRMTTASTLSVRSGFSELGRAGSEWTDRKSTRLLQSRQY